MSQRFFRESERSSTKAGRGHGVLCAQPVSVRNQQAGPDPERPTGLHEMESERIHPAVYLVRERAENRLDPQTSHARLRCKQMLTAMSCAQTCARERERIKLNTDH